MTARVMDMEKLRKRRDEDSTRHNKILDHANVAASATLPIGFGPCAATDHKLLLGKSTGVHGNQNPRHLILRIV